MTGGVWWRMKRFEVDLREELPVMRIRGGEDLFEFRLELMPRDLDDLIEFARDVLAAVLHLHDSTEHDGRHGDGRDFQRVRAAKKVLDAVVDSRRARLREKWDKVMGRRD